MEHAHYAKMVETYFIRNQLLFEGQRHYKRWHRIPLGSGHLFFLLSCPVFTFGFLIVFYLWVIPWSVTVVLYILSITFLLLALGLYGYLWSWGAPMRGHINEYRGSIDGVAEQVLKVVPAIKVVTDRLSEDRLVLDIQEGSMLVGLFNWPVGTERVFVHIRPDPRADGRMLRQLMDRLDRNLAN